MKTGFKDLDNIIKLRKGELIVIASRPAMGKSTFAENILSNVAINENKKVLFFSLEESKESIVNKLIISNAMVEVDKFKLYEKYQKLNSKKPELSDEDWDRITYGVKLLKDASIYIVNDAPYTINDIFKNSRELKLKEGIDLIVIDYLQLIQFDKSELLSRDNEIKEILKRLKKLAKELDIPIIITSQLSRKIENREDKRPYIYDFHNYKNAILTYADKILFLYRDSYYNKNNTSNITEVIVAKNNSGDIDTVKLAWMPEYCMFGNTIDFMEVEDE